MKVRNQNKNETFDTRDYHKMSHIHKSGMSGGGCDCLHKPTGTEQTLDELDWERGIRKKWKNRTWIIKMYKLDWIK